MLAPPSLLGMQRFSDKIDCWGVTSDGWRCLPLMLLGMRIARGVVKIDRGLSWQVCPPCESSFRRPIKVGQTGGSPFWTGFELVSIGPTSWLRSMGDRGGCLWVIYRGEIFSTSTFVRTIFGSVLFGCDRFKRCKKWGFLEIFGHKKWHKSWRKQRYSRSKPENNWSKSSKLWVKISRLIIVNFSKTNYTPANPPPLVM